MTGIVSIAVTFCKIVDKTSHNLPILSTREREADLDDCVFYRGDDGDAYQHDGKRRMHAVVCGNLLLSVEKAMHLSF